MTPVHAQLDWHQRLRTSGVPTITVLVGATSSCEAVWRAWAEHEARDVVVATHDVTRALRAWMLSGGRTEVSLFRLLAERLNMSPEELTRRVSRSTVHERRRMLTRAALGLGEPVSTLCDRWLRATSESTTLDEAFEALCCEGHERACAADWLRHLFRAEAMPAVLCEPGQSSGQVSAATHALYQVMEVCPSLPVALAVTIEAFNDYLLNEPESREKALLRGAVIALEHEPPVRQEWQAVALSLKQAGASETTLAAFERLAQSPLERLRHDDGARSEAERFLANLLAELPFTAGLFELNGHLPIPFGSRPDMEVDLLCRRFKVALEVDGYHHFQDEARYRADRAKDYLLQRQGYLVLRFLAEDVVKNLEAIIERLHDALDSRSSQMT